MVFTEMLKTQGLSEEQVKGIIKEMNRNRIFITYEEKIEERYRKMKQQRDQLRDTLLQAKAAMGELNKVLMTDRIRQSDTGVNHDINRSGEEVSRKHDQ